MGPNCSISVTSFSPKYDKIIEKSKSSRVCVCINEKMVLKSEKGIFVGYDEEISGCHIYFPGQNNTKKMFFSLIT